MALFPAEVGVDAATGALTARTGRYEKRLSEMEGLFRDGAAWARAAEAGDPLVYAVEEYRAEGSDLFFGTTTIEAGEVGGEFFMTRGHFHARADRGEVYGTLSGEGLLVLEDREGRAETVPMRPGGLAFIPPGWAHRSVNTGAEPLVFTWVCNLDAGHDYGPIRARGMRLLVVAGAAGAEVVDSKGRG